MLLFAGLVLAGSAYWLAGDACFGQQPPRRIAVRLSGELFAPQIEQPIDQRLPVDELILGVRATGQAHVTGQPRLVMADDADEGAFCVTIAGQVESRTIGCKGPVQIHSRSDMRFAATKRVTYRPGWGFVGEPAQIQAQTTSQVDRIEPFCKGSLGRMIERQAWIRVEDSQEQVRRIVQAKAEAKIQQAFDRLLEQRLARLNRLANLRYVVAAVVGGSEKPAYHCCTRDGSLIIMAASGEAPDLAPAASDVMDYGRHGPLVQVWVHEGVVGDWPAAMLRGVEVSRLMLFRPAIAQTSDSRTESSEKSARTYDFTTRGDWIVVHSGEWNRDAVTVARTDGAAAAARLAVGGGQ